MCIILQSHLLLSCVHRRVVAFYTKETKYNWRLADIISVQIFWSRNQTVCFDGRYNVGCMYLSIKEVCGKLCTVSRCDDDTFVRARERETMEWWSHDKF